ncbi:MAG: type VI secretion system tip protein TssI/VgrG [Polyangiaceae bacterium]
MAFGRGSCRDSVLLAESVNSRIFQNKTVKDIVTEVLTDHGFVSSELTFSLFGNHPTWEYVVQYQETSLNFISRLLEREGIYFYAACEGEGQEEKFYFSDDSTVAKSVPSPSELVVRNWSTRHEEESGVYGFERHHRVTYGKAVLTDYDYHAPKKKLSVTAVSPENTTLELRHFPGDFVELDTGKALAQIRLDAERTEFCSYTITASCPNLSAGRQVTVLVGDKTHELFLYSVVQRYVVHADDGSSPRPWDFEVEAEAVPLLQHYRVPLIHPKPVMDGPQTAVVMAPDGSPPEEIHTDELARCRVRFHWDRAGIDNDKASCWMRVSQLQTSGSMALPRVGWEVIVDFVNGDPDCPMVTGLLYTGTHMPPYALPEGATRTAIRSNSSPGGGGVNEIRFEDKAGAEEIMIGSQYNMSIVTANNRSKVVTKDETLVVGNNAQTQIGANDTITVGNGAKIQIGANQDVTVGVARTMEVNAVSGLTVAGNATTSVGGMQFEMNGSPLAGLIAAVSAKAAAVAAAKAEQAIAEIQGAVQGKIDQVMAPINKLTAQADKLGGAVTALGAGDFSMAGSLAGGVGGLASAGLGGSSGGLAALGSAGGGDRAGVIAGTNAITGKLTDALGGVTAKATSAVSDAIEGFQGASGSGGGDKSMANRGGPAADLAGFSESDAATGPGHAQYTVTGSHSETTGAAHILAAVGGVNLNVTGSMTQTVGAALVELVKGDHAESVEGVKSETQIGLIVATKGDESENASGSLAYTVGGAIIEKVNGSMAMSGGAGATFLGALHKIRCVVEDYADLRGEQYRHRRQRHRRYERHGQFHGRSDGDLEA